MTATTFSDAKKECSINARCYMFFDDTGTGNKFLSCGNTASIKETTVGSILYQNHGNEMTGHSKVLELDHKTVFQNIHHAYLLSKIA